jgi:DNA-binding transcriptional regulator YiaG
LTPVPQRRRIGQLFPKRTAIMDKTEFRVLRKKLRKTQKQMAQLLGVSLKAVHSYEQGWRAVPPAVERHVLFLMSLTGPAEPMPPCWDVKNCLPEQRAKCPASELNCGDRCWMVNGTISGGADQGSWENKMEACRACPVFRARIPL